jgi:Ca2+-binding RTX toxin-like protein
MSLPRASAVVVATVMLFAVCVAATATTVVPASRAGSAVQAISVNLAKPAACSGITLSRVISGAGVIDDTGSASSLVLGSPGIDTIRARAGNDCVVGGGGNDAITGGAGIDVCLGGPGTDTFASCETFVQ